MSYNNSIRLQKKTQSSRRITSPRKTKLTDAQKKIFKAQRESLEDAFYKQLIIHRLHFERQYKFIEGRKFAFDFADTYSKVAIEIEGGVFIKKRTGHTSISGILRDIEKYNAAASLGWLVIRATVKDLQDETFYQLIYRTLSQANSNKRHLIYPSELEPLKIDMKETDKKMQDISDKRKLEDSLRIGNAKIGQPPK